MPAVFRIGITMRETMAPNYPEPRDSLAHDWTTWLAAVLPELAWMPLPNMGARITEHVENWKIDGLIFSGGEDPGSSPRRDATENALLDWALAGGVPVLGVCRGAQFLWQRHGGSLAEWPSHIACHHPVLWQEAAAQYAQHGSSSVASFHRLALRGKGQDLIPLALDESGHLEAFTHTRSALLGIMWHPERTTTPALHDRQLVRMFFGLKN